MGGGQPLDPLAAAPGLFSGSPAVRSGRRALRLKLLGAAATRPALLLFEEGAVTRYASLSSKAGPSAEPSEPVGVILPAGVFLFASSYSMSRPSPRQRRLLSA